MATSKKMGRPKSKEIKEEDVSQTPAEQRTEWNRAADMIKQLNKFTLPTKLKVFIGSGVGSEFFTCYMCGAVKPRAQFYNCTDFNVRTGVSRICKQCFEELAQPRTDKTTDEVDAAREGLKYALEYLDQPFYEHLYQSAVREASSARTSTSDQPYKCYKRTVAMPAYKGQRYRDGDAPVIDRNIAEIADGNKTMTAEEYEEFQKNKADALKVTGYYPFENEPLPDQPFLYAQFSGYLDAQNGEDYAPFWLTSVISIIKDSAHLEKLNNALNELTKDPATIATNINAINNIVASKAKLSAAIAKNAQESCISANSSRSTVKGNDTWTGQMAHLKDLNLRDYDVNKFDIDTAAGMQQVSDISMASIFKELSLDENDMAEIVKSQRELLSKAHHEADVARERARLLLKENLDLKRYLKEQGIHFEHLLTNNELFDQGFFSAKASSIVLDEDGPTVYEVEPNEANEFNDDELTEQEADENTDAEYEYELDDEDNEYMMDEPESEDDEYVADTAIDE